MQIDFLCNKMQFLDVLVSSVWAEWKDDYIRFTPYKTLEMLKDGIGICTARMAQSRVGKALT